MVGRHHSKLPKDSSVFEVAVGDGPCHVALGDKLLLDGDREGKAPHEGLAVSIEVDTAHSSFGSVSGPKEHGVLRHYLSKVCGTGTKVGGETAEGVDVVT